MAKCPQASHSNSGRNPYLRNPNLLNTKDETGSGARFTREEAWSAACVMATTLWDSPACALDPAPASAGFSICHTGAYIHTLLMWVRGGIPYKALYIMKPHHFTPFASQIGQLIWPCTKPTSVFLFYLCIWACCSRHRSLAYDLGCHDQMQGSALGWHATYAAIMVSTYCAERVVTLPKLRISL